MVNIDALELLYFVNGYSVPYELKKGGEIKISPILVRDYPFYENAVSILKYEKNTINDIKIIQMSYLEFLIEVVFTKEGSDNLIQQLLWLIVHCLGYEFISFERDKNKWCIALCNENKEIEKIISPKEFDEIAKIILNQNDPNYDDRYLSPDVKEAYEEYCKLKYKNVGNPSLERKKAFVIGKNGYTLEQINEMPYRFFSLVYNECIDSEIYIGEKIIQGSYKYKVDENIVHPQFREKKDPIAEMFSDAGAFENKIKQVNG